MLAFYAAMARGKASLVAPLTALFPLFTVVGAVLLLKEKLNRVQVLGLAMAVIAVVIFAR
jgi:transporter family protein